MKTLFTFSLSFLLLISCRNDIIDKKPLVAKIDPVEDIYFGKTIVDPYRYMENLEDSAVVEWIKSQAKYARKVLNSIPGRQSLINKMVEFDARRSSLINKLAITDDDRYFYLKQTPNDETGKLYYRIGYEGEEILLFDPFTYDDDSTKKYVISGLLPSIDGSKVVFGLAEGGSESAITLIMDVDKKALYPEKIKNCYPSYSWLDDNMSFAYTPLHSDDVKDINRSIDLEAKLHIVGTLPANDRIILSRKTHPELGMEPKEIPDVIYDKDCGYLFGIASTVDKNLKVYYAPEYEINDKRIIWLSLIEPEDEIHDAVMNKKELYLLSSKNAPNCKILKTDLINPDIKNTEVVVSEDQNDIIVSFNLTSDGLYYTLSKNGVEEKLLFLAYNSDTPVELSLPFKAGSISLQTKGAEYSDTWINISGWTNNDQRYRYLPKTNEFKLENLSDKADYPEYKDLVVEELMVESHDGVMVPLSLVYNKGIKRDGQIPVLIFGYGGYGISINPFFSPKLFLLWVAEGGVFAVAHVRGGGELGDEWHKGGFKTTKPNIWKDLIACSEYLIKESYTSKEKIAIYAGSNGGILVGRAMTERPDLFAAVISAVGAMNTLRLENTPNGPANVPEFGTTKDSIEFMALLEMDSYHHLTDGVKYPATLITAGMNDPRIIAWQPAKFAARLQEVNVSDEPILFLTDFDAGHGVGDTKTKQFESWADVLSFALWNTGHPEFQIE